MSFLERIRNTGGEKTVFCHPERELAGEYGLSHDLLKATRAEHLKRGSDWEQVGGLICYTGAAATRVLTLLKISPAGPPAPGAPLPLPADSAPNDGAPAEPVPKNYAAPAEGEERELVCSAVVRNRRILKAADQGNEAWVRVRNSKNFRPGMPLRARFLGGTQWQLVGRGPRWGGKF